MNSYDTKTWAWEARVNALKSELDVQATETRKLRSALEEIAGLPPQKRGSVSYAMAAIARAALALRQYQVNEVCMGGDE